MRNNVFGILLSFHSLRALRFSSIVGRMAQRATDAFASSSSSGGSSEPSPAAFSRQVFDESLSLVAIKIPAKLCTQYMTRFKDHVFQRPRMKRILDVEGDKEHRLILLNAQVTLAPATEEEEEEERGKQSTEQDKEPLLGRLLGLPEELGVFIRETQGAAQPYTLHLGYEHLTVEEVLHKLLPQGSEVPSSFEQAGHIAHLNLRDEMLPFKHMIGQVILDKNPSLRTVVNKMGNIENEFRTFPMEVIAGQNDFDVTVRESGAKLAFNFRNVYWNSRLQTEHARLIQMLKSKAASASVMKGQALVVADMMAGVGPFAVPLAMHQHNSHPGIVLHANDLNPESHAALVKNSKVNRIQHGRLSSYNCDAREFVVALVSKQVFFHEAIMNLPANATDFLDVFIGLETRYKKVAGKSRGGGGGEAPSVSTDFTLPRIHVYAFSTAADPVADIAARAASVLQCDVSLLELTAAPAPGEFDAMDAVACWGHVVRDVSPKKLMVCLSFFLPRQVALAEPIHFSFEAKSGVKREGDGEGDGEVEMETKKSKT